MTRLVHSSLTRAVETANIIIDVLNPTSSSSPSASHDARGSTLSQSPSHSLNSNVAAPDEGIVADDACPADNTSNQSPDKLLPKGSSGSSTLPVAPKSPNAPLVVDMDPQLREGTPFMTEPMLPHWLPNDKVRVRFLVDYWVEYNTM